MAIQEDDDGDEEPQGKGVVGGCLVRLVEGVGFGEFRLVVR